MPNDYSVANKSMMSLWTKVYNPNVPAIGRRFQVAADSQNSLRLRLLSS